jgi:hypothetical protein
MKMKTVTIGWSEKVYYLTTMEVPENWDHPEIEDAFWAMDLSQENPVDTDYVGVDFIEEVVESK